MPPELKTNSHAKAQRREKFFNEIVTPGKYPSFMNEQEKETFVVQCIWCGTRIRDDKEEETTGVCLSCFYQILNNHLHAQKQTLYGDFVSDR